MEEALDSINAFKLSLSKVKNVWRLLLKTRLQLDICFFIETVMKGQQTAAWIKIKKGTGLKEMFEGKQ